MISSTCEAIKIGDRTGSVNAKISHFGASRNLVLSDQIHLIVAKSVDFQISLNISFGLPIFFNTTKEIVTVLQQIDVVSDIPLCNGSSVTIA